MIVVSLFGFHPLDAPLRDHFFFAARFVRDQFRSLFADQPFGGVRRQIDDAPRFRGDAAFGDSDFHSMPYNPAAVG
jgi:hypothetical protein